MPKYTDFWQDILTKFTADFENNTEPLEQTYANTGLSELGDRQSYKGYLELFGTDVKRHTKSQVLKDLAEAIKKKTSLRNKLTGLLEVRVDVNDSIEFNYTPFSWELMMNRYRDAQDKTQSADELFKWEQVKQFQDAFLDYEKGNLSFESLMFDSKWDQLVDEQRFYPVRALLMKTHPEEYEQAYLKLLDEEIDVQQRIDAYTKTIDTLFKPHKTDKLTSHIHDERTIATLLTYRYPDKYTFFMSTFYKRLCRCIGEKPRAKNEAFVHYMNLVEQIQKEVLPKFEDVVAANAGFIQNPKYFHDPNQLLLIQDILYVSLYKGSKVGEAVADEMERDDELKDVLSQFTYAEVMGYLHLMDAIVTHADLSAGDKRLLFSLNERRLNFSVGQRYAALLFPPSQRAKEALCNVIATASFGRRSESFDGKSPLAYFNRLDDFQLSDAELAQVFAAVDQELARTGKSGYRRHNNESFERFIFDAAHRNELLTSIFDEHDNTINNMDDLNIILYGPPGTGKTYNTIDLAVEIIDGKIGDHPANKKRYDALVKNEKIVFCTFHQSMSYEDFVEGLKPKSIEGNVEYEVEPGVFKRICASARSSQRMNNFEAAYRALLDEIKANGGSLVLETLVHSREYTIYENSKRNIKFHSKTEKANEAVIRKEVIEHYLKTGEALDWSSYVKPIAQRLVERYGYAENESASASKFVLVIDEINRGNVSQIFGELITLIEPDKRAGKPDGLKVTLPYSKTEFSVPENLYIIGTMNTADRSVEALDTALRRRFSFVEMPPRYDLEELSQGPAGIDLKQMLRTINHRIEKLLDKDHMIGHAYFIGVKDIGDLRHVFKDKILPLLQEYFFGDFGKIGLVLGESFVVADQQRFTGFARFNYSDDGAVEDLEAKRVFTITPPEQWDFKGIYTP